MITSYHSISAEARQTNEEMREECLSYIDWTIKGAQGSGGKELKIANMKAEDFLGEGEHKTVHKILNSHAKRKIKLNARKWKKLWCWKLQKLLQKVISEATEEDKSKKVERWLKSSVMV